MNTGTLRRSVGTGNVTFQRSSHLSNKGTIELLTGKLVIASGGSGSTVTIEHTGDFIIAPDATLEFDGGLHNITGNNVFPGINEAGLQGTLSVITQSTLVTGAGDHQFNGLISVGGGSLTFNGQVQSPGNLSVSSGVLSVNGSFSLSGDFNWNGGTLAGSGNLDISKDSKWLIATTVGKAMSGALNINNEGTATWTAGNISQNTHTGTLHNLGVFDMQGNGISFGVNFANMTGLFLNTGILRRSVGTGNVIFERSSHPSNNGTFELLTGKVILRSAGSAIEQNGNFMIAPVATLEFDGGLHIINGDNVFLDTNGGGPMGTFSVISSNTQVTIEGNQQFDGLLSLVSGSLVFNGNYSLTGDFIWNSGTLTGTGNLNFATGSKWQIATTAGKTITGPLNINNEGTATWTAGNITQNTHTGTLHNLGVFDMQGDGIIFGVNFANITGLFLNTGTLRRSVGTGNATFERSSHLSNKGTIELLSGKLIIRSGGAGSTVTVEHTGNFIIAPVTTLEFDGGLHTVNGNNVFLDTNGGGAKGTLSVLNSTNQLTILGNQQFDGLVSVGGGSLTINGQVQSNGNLTVGSGVLNVNGSFSQAGDFNWNGGTLTGSGNLDITKDSKWLIATTATKTISGALNINNEGVATWEAGNISQNTHTGTLHNLGVFDIQGDNISFGVNFANITGLFLNTGTLRRTVGTGNAIFERSSHLSNNGTFELLTGKLILRSGGAGSAVTVENTGLFEIKDQAVLSFNAGAYRFTESATIKGSGELELSGATITNNGTISPGDPVGTLKVTGNFPMSSSTAKVAIHLGGNQPGVNHDQLTVSGAATLNGSVAITLADGFVPTTGQEFTILTAGSITGTFQNVIFPDLGPGNQFAAVYDGTNVKVQYNGSPIITPGTTYTWIGPADGDWHTATHWTPNGIPGEGDEVIVNTGARIGIKSPVKVASLLLSFPTNDLFPEITLNSSLTITSSFNWESGTIRSDEPGEIIIESGATWNFGTIRFKQFNGAITINMNGTINYNAATLSLGTSANVVFNNNGTFNLLSNSTIGGGGSGAIRMEFINNGIFRKTEGTGTSSVGNIVKFLNFGSLEVLSGRLDINSILTANEPLVHEGTFLIGNEASLFFGNGTHLLNEQSVISGPGGNPSSGTLGIFAQAGLGNPNVSVNGSMSFDGTLSVNNGRIILNQPYQVPSITQNSGTLEVNAPLTISTQYLWTSGTLSGNAQGIVALPSQAVLNMTTGNSRTVDGSITINLDGTANHGSGFFNTTATSNVTLNNNGLIDIQGDLQAFGGGGSGSYRMTLNNFGTFRKSAGTGVSSIASVVFLNTPGTIEVLSGQLNITSGQFINNDPFTHNGKFIIANQASLYFAGGNHILSSESTVTGPDGQTSPGTLGIFANAGIGTPFLTLSGIVNHQGPITVANGTLRMDQPYSFPSVTMNSGTLEVNSTLTITSELKWNNGVLTGNNAGIVNIPAGAVADLTGGSSRNLSGSITFNNAGTLNWTQGFFENGIGAESIIFNNSGLFNMQGDLRFGGGGTGHSIFLTNSGIIRKSAGTGTGSIANAVQLTNLQAGRIEIQSGRFDFVSSQSNPVESSLINGIIELANSSSLGFTGARYILGSQGVIRGVEGGPTSGQIILYSNVAAPNLTVEGTILSNGTISQSSGTLTLSPSGIMQGNFTYNRTGGTFTNNGTLSPGNPLGAANITGAFPMSTSTAKLAIQLGGDQAGVTHDQLTVSGAATLAGTLDIRLSGAFVPTPGQEFTILTAGSISGTFQNVTFTNMGPGNQFVAVYDGTSVKAQYNGSVITPPATYTWVGPSSGGIWHDAPNWSPVGVPGFNDEAIINSGNVTVNDPVLVGNINIDGNTFLNLNNSLTVNQLMLWNWATLTGPASGSLNIPENAQLTIGAGFTHNVGGTITINLNGTTLWTQGPIGQNQSTNVIINNTGVFEMRGDLTFGTFNAYWGTFNNSGVFRKVSGTGDGFFESSIRVNNTGLIEVLSGNLNFRSGSFNPGAETLHEGTIEVANNANLRFVGGIHRLPQGGVISVPGGAILRAGLQVITGASLILDRELALEGELLFNSAAFTINTAQTFPTLVADGNTFMFLNDELTITNSMTMGFGRIHGPASGALTISQGAQLNIRGNFGLSLGNQLRLNLHGTTLWTAGNIGHVGATDVVINNTGLFEMDGDLTLGTFNAYWGTLNNSGTFRKSSGSGDGFIESSIRINNTGLIEIKTGTLNIRSGSFNAGTETVHEGKIVVDDNAMLNFIGGVHRLPQGGVISGPGGAILRAGLQVITGASLILDQELALEGDLLFNSATFTINTAQTFPTLVADGNSFMFLNDELTITNSMTMGFGRIHGPASGALTIPQGSQLNIGSSNGMLFGNALRVNLHGTTSWTAGAIGQVPATTDIVINNTGLFEMDGDLSLGTGNAYWGTLNNSGTFRKKSGTGAGSILSSIRLVNTGLIEVLSGELNIRSGNFNPGTITEHTGTIFIAESATLAILAGAHNLVESGIITGNGILNLTGGSFTNNGTISPGNPIGSINVNGAFPMSSSSAKLAIELGGKEPGISHDQLVVTGNADLNGTLAITLSPGFFPEPQQEFVILEATSIESKFDNITFPNLGPDNVFVAEYSANTVTVRYDGKVLSAPIAENDSATTDFNSPVIIDVLANDLSPNGDPLKIIEVSKPENGTAEITGENTILYTPNSDFSGDDSFTYTISNTLDETSTATVFVTVHEKGTEPQPPVAINDAATTEANTPVDIDVLANDSDPLGLAITIIAITQPEKGNVQIIQQGSTQIIRYTPDQDFSGEDQFSYTIANTANLTATTFVIVTVLPAITENRPPVALDDAARTVMELPVVIDVLANDTDPDGDEITILGFQTTSASGGAITLVQISLLQYTPPSGFTGSDNFRYSITDGRGGVDTASVVVEVFPIRFEVILTGAPGTRGMAIGEDGSVAGIRFDGDGAVQAFYQNPTGVVNFASPGMGSQIFGLAGITMAGVVQVNDTTAAAHKFLTNGTTAPLGDLGGNFSLAYGINASGAITGISRDPQGRYRAFLFEDGQGMEDITPAGFVASTGFAINNQNIVAGFVEDTNGAERAWINNTIVSQVNTRAYSINNNNTAVGSILLNGIVEAVRWNSDGTFSQLPASIFGFAEAYSISDMGWIAGTAAPNPFAGATKSGIVRPARRMMPFLKSTQADQGSSFIDGQHAVVWISGSFFNLNELIDPSLGWNLLEAAAVNNAGQIAGTGIHQGQVKAFVLNPVDELPPVTKDFAETITVDSELLLELSHLNGHHVKLVYTSSPRNGQVIMENGTTLRYIPAAGYEGSDSFVYALSNGRSFSTGQIDVDVKRNEVAHTREILSQNYPNPFSTVTTITFHHAEDGVILLEVFDLFGQRVKVIHSGWLRAGEYSFNTDSAGIGSGTYVYRLTGHSGIQSRRMTIVK